jgi:hypothetical protein
MTRKRKPHHVDAGSSQGWINHDAFTRFGLRDERTNVSLLFGNERRDVRLETPCANTHDNDGKAKSSKRPLRMRDDRWNGRDDQYDVADEGNSHRDRDSFESAPLLIRNIGT